MDNWNSGYVTDLGYTYGYFPELNPHNATLALLRAGIEPPKVINACELGFGQGISVNINASSNIIQWHGTDFNPDQASFACELAEQAKNGAKLSQQSFLEFCNRDDLPDFDFVGLHGVWSWVSDENRLLIVEFLRKKLNLNGIVYISYNAMPGAANFLAARHLLTQHALTYGSIENGLSRNITDSLGFLSDLMRQDTKAARANPSLQKKIDNLRNQNPEYLAHEYYNADWAPMHFSEVRNLLLGAKLEYACSASYSESVDPLHYTDEQIKFLSNINDQTFKETTRDFIVNKLFRKDYWIKGKRTLSNSQIKRSIREQNLTLVVNREHVPTTVTGARGKADLPQQIYGKILDILADNKTKKFDDLEVSLNDDGIHFEALLQAIYVLMGLGCLTSCTASHQQKDKISSLNNILINKSKSSNKIKYLVSPVTGTAVNLSRFEILFVDALNQKTYRQRDVANYVWSILVSENERLIKDNVPIVSEKENIAELEKQVAIFLKEKRDVLNALQIVKS